MSRVGCILLKLTTVRFVFPLLLILPVSSCIWDGLTGPSKPSKVTVTPETALLTFVGQTFQLNVRVEDRDGSALAYSTITWSSGDPSVASVSATGIITAKKEGRTTIAATVEGVTGQVVITVEWPKPVTIIIRPSTDLLLESLGETRQLSATVLDRQGRILVGVRVVWSSSDATVVAVDSLGVMITSTGRGTVLITAMAGDASATKKVTVSQGLIRLILPDRPITLKLGETYQLSPKVVDSDGNKLPPSRLRSYSSTMPAVAMVDSVGMITATGYGTVTIRIRTGYKPTISWPFFLSGTLEVVVGPVSGVVVLTRREVLLTPGDKQWVDVWSDDEEAFRFSRLLFTWHSSDPAVATIDSRGRITAVSAGTTTVRAERAFTFHDEVISGEMEVRVAPGG